MQLLLWFSCVGDAADFTELTPLAKLIFQLDEGEVGKSLVRNVEWAQAI